MYPYKQSGIQNAVSIQSGQYYLINFGAVLSSLFVGMVKHYPVVCPQKIKYDNGSM